MAKNSRELQAEMPPASRARSQARAEAMLKDMALDELREAMHLTQAHLAKILNVTQSAISELERRADMYVSTLTGFVSAMGARLEIRAAFPSGEVRISQFGKLDLPGKRLHKRTVNCKVPVLKIARGLPTGSTISPSPSVHRLQCEEHFLENRRRTWATMLAGPQYPLNSRTSFEMPSSPRHSSLSPGWLPKRGESDGHWSEILSLPKSRGTRFVPSSSRRGRVSEDLSVTPFARPVVLEQVRLCLTPHGNGFKRVEFSFICSWR
jgi:predicted XRE-type DNA-binding protein